MNTSDMFNTLQTSLRLRSTAVSSTQWSELFICQFLSKHTMHMYPFSTHNQIIETYNLCLKILRVHMHDSENTKKKKKKAVPALQDL